MVYRWVVLRDKQLVVSMAQRKAERWALCLVAQLAILMADQMVSTTADRRVSNWVATKDNWWENGSVAMLVYSVVGDSVVCWVE